MVQKPSSDALAGIMGFVMSFIAERQRQRRVISLRDDADWPAGMASNKGREETRPDLDQFVKI
ncbi:hypothetical protein INR49_009931 [Caranx melampygus]|nr:hypothetical protein INR49_010470 [Caranx melampygus]KAG7232048.1 hypothetical protein INR49_009931 [Caranx melampygus]